MAGVTGTNAHSRCPGTNTNADSYSDFWHDANSHANRLSYGKSG